MISNQKTNDECILEIMNKIYFFFKGTITCAFTITQQGIEAVLKQCVHIHLRNRNVQCHPIRAHEHDTCNMHW